MLAIQVVCDGQEDAARMVAQRFARELAGNRQAARELIPLIEDGRHVRADELGDHHGRHGRDCNTAWTWRRQLGSRAAARTATDVAAAGRHTNHRDRSRAFAYHVAMTDGQSDNQQLSDMPGLGPVTASWLHQIGISCGADLRAADPFEVYARLKAQIPGVNILALYAIIGAIEARHWQDIRRERRAGILLRLDELGLAPR